MEKEFVRNQYGVQIVKCCASCVHNGLTSHGDDMRVCKRGFGENPSCFLCKGGWKMKAGLEEAGRGDGKVKRKAYFDYIWKNGLHHSEDFERRYGSKYLNDN